MENLDNKVFIDGVSKGRVIGMLPDMSKAEFSRDLFSIVSSKEIPQNLAFDLPYIGITVNTCLDFLRDFKICGDIGRASSAEIIFDNLYDTVKILNGSYWLLYHFLVVLLDSDKLDYIKVYYSKEKEAFMKGDLKF